MVVNIDSEASTTQKRHNVTNRFDNDHNEPISSINFYDESSSNNNKKPPLPSPLATKNTMTTSAYLSSPSSSMKALIPSLENVTEVSSKRKHDHEFDVQFSNALNIAGVALSLLTTVFSLFHVDVFLRIYELPLQAYSKGNMFFCIVNTFNDLMGAYLLDAAATKMNRSDLIGLSGCLCSLCFLAPFFRWRHSNAYDTTHFIASISIYDTFYSFTMILLGSLVTDNHHLTDKERVNFMASGNALNLFASFFVAKISLEIFDTDNMHQFRIFLVLLALLVALLFLISQMMINFHIIVNWKKMRIRFVNHYKRRLDHQNPIEKRQKLSVSKVAVDFLHHRNFWSWIGMEIFLESQISFTNAFLKTFVDRLVLPGGVSKEESEWLLSAIRPVTLICTILCYVPIRQFGYKRLYEILFVTNITLCLCILICADHRSTDVIVAFLIIYPAITGAVASAGFHLVMSDMVLERNRMQAIQGRIYDASVPALFIGVNALFCKPATYFLPVIASNILDPHFEAKNKNNEEVQIALFKLLIYPPLLFSFIELLSWSRFKLTPHTTNQMREELRESEMLLHSYLSSEQILA